MRAKKAPAKAKAKKVAARKTVHSKASVHARPKARAKSRIAPKAVARKPAPVRKHMTGAARPAPEPAKPIVRTMVKPAPRTWTALADRPPIRIIPPAAHDGDDGDGGDSSLLSGPRNVQPYIPKRGEQYMSKEQLDHFRLLLVGLACNLLIRPVSEALVLPADEPDVGAAAGPAGDSFAGTHRWAVALAWTAVGVPLLWGLWNTFDKARALFG